jgi:nucleotide-binding universal stress UspA family protein
MLFRKILLPVDANTAEAAVRYARQVASAARAELCLLRVAKESLYRSHQYDWPQEAYGHTVSGLPPPARMILPGRPAEMIVGYADHIEADLILMPTRGHGPLGQLLFGSTTMDVIRSTTRAVWVAKKPYLRVDGPFSCRRIVCGIDVTPEGQAVLNHASKAAAAWHADLVIVHAIPGISDAMLARYGLDEGADIELLPEAARRKIWSMAARINIPCQVHVRIDDPAEYLLRTVKEWCADLLIVGRGKRTSRWSVGANIARLIERSNCPVITFAPGRLAASRSNALHHLWTSWRNAALPSIVRRQSIVLTPSGGNQGDKRIPRAQPSVSVAVRKSRTCV